MSRLGRRGPSFAARTFALVGLLAVLAAFWLPAPSAHAASATQPVKLGAKVTCLGDTVQVDWKVTNLLSVPVHLELSAATPISTSSLTVSPDTPGSFTQTLSVIARAATIYAVATPDGGSPIDVTGNRPLGCTIPPASTTLSFAIDGQAVCDVQHGAWIIQLHVTNTGSATIALPAGWVPTYLPPTGVATEQFALLGSTPSPYEITVMASAGSQSATRDLSIALPGSCSLAVPPPGTYPPGAYPPSSYPPFVVPPGWILVPAGTWMGPQFASSPAPANDHRYLPATGPAATIPLSIASLAFLTTGTVCLIAARRSTSAV